MLTSTGIDRVGDVVTDNIFGGNVLAYRTGMDGPNEHGAAIDDLGITDLRYPGGSTTEYYLDLTNPNATTATHSETGEVIDFLPLNEFMAYAGDNGHAVTLVLPTRYELTQTVDANGHRYADVDEDLIRGFVNDVVSGVYGSADIRAFEIGNEYWGSGGMDAVEYGRVAAQMTQIVQDELTILAQEHCPEALGIDIVVQMGLNYGSSQLDGATDATAPSDIVDYFNTTYALNMGNEALYNGGGVNYTHITNELILAELNAANVFDDVDGVVAHVYSLGDIQPWSKTWELKEIEDTWMQRTDELDTYVTEWNLKGVTQTLSGLTDYGLYQAREMLNIVEEFVAFGVDYAHVWPLIQNTDNTLNRGWTYDETNAPGAFFRIMNDTLPGKTLLDFDTDDRWQTEAHFDDFSVHGFADRDELALFVTTSHRDGLVYPDLDVSGLVQDYGRIELSVLGVPDGALPGNNDSVAVLEDIDPADAVSADGIDVPLDPGEILIIKIQDYTPSDALDTVVSAAFPDASAIIVDDAPDPIQDSSSGTDDDPVLPTVPVADDTILDGEGDDDIDIDSGGFEGLIWLLALAPLLAVFGMR